MKARLKVDFAGPYVSIQDIGRFGRMRFGVPESGPMDRLSFAAANIALGQPATGSVIEISMGGLVLECLEGTVTFAVAGGGFIVDHAGHKGGSWLIRTIEAGQKLAIRPGPWGSWTYLAFAADLESKQWLGHASTHSLSGFGGGMLKTGQDVILRNPRILEEREGDITCPALARPRNRVRVTLGPQDERFDPDMIQAFLTDPYRLTSAYDRMGVRLSGTVLQMKESLSIPSEPIVRGSVQVAGNGIPTVLLADHQTSGGYPKIATVISGDVDGFVQLRPHDLVSFKAVSPDEAIAIARQRQLQTAPFFKAIAKPRGRRNKE